MPTNHGAIEAPTVRATPVIPAAAERSSGRTTAIKYDCLVGTSIWLMLKRSEQDRNRQRQRRHQRHEDEQNVRRKMSEDHRSNEAETRCQPGREQRGDSGEDIRAKENRAERAGIHTEAKVEPIGRQALNDEAAAESIQGEQSGKLEDNASRVPDAQQLRCQDGAEESS